MPTTFEETTTRLHGAWRLMNGKPDGLQELDLSADGFWNSFFAMMVALPPLIVGWVEGARFFGSGDDDVGTRLSMLGRLAFIDFAAWVVPIVALGLVARRIGIGDRFVAYVVASNWATAILVWMTLPPVLLGMLFPPLDEAAGLVSLGLFFATIVFDWRLTNASLAKGPTVATAVLAGSFLLSLLTLLALQALLGLYPASAG